MSVLGAEVLQDVLVVAVVHVVAVDFQDNLAGLKTRSGRLPACRTSKQIHRSKVKRRREQGGPRKEFKSALL